MQTAPNLAFDLFPERQLGLTFSPFGVAEIKTYNPGNLLSTGKRY